jgi:hypothetical protein
VTTHLLLLPSLRKSGAIPSLPHTSSPLPVQPIYEPDVPRPRRQQQCGVLPSETNSTLPKKRRNFDCSNIGIVS